MQDFDKLWNYSQPEEIHTKFQSVLEQSKVSGNETYIGQLYTQLARTQSLQGKWGNAYAYLDKAKTLLTLADKVTEVRYLLELGRTYNSSGNRQKAYEHFHQAWELAKAVGADRYAVDALHMLAIASDTPQSTLDWNLKAVDYAKSSTQAEAKKWLGSLFNNLGWTYFKAGDIEIALDYFQQALIQREQQGDVDNIRIAQWCVAKAKRVLGQVADALQIQEGLLAEYQADDSEIEYVYEELALCYLALENQTQAKHYAQLAYAILSKDSWIVENEAERLNILKNMV